MIDGDIRRSWFNTIITAAHLDALGTNEAALYQNGQTNLCAYGTDEVMP